MGSRTHVGVGLVVTLTSFIVVNVLINTRNGQVPTVPVIGGTPETIVTPAFAIAGYILGFSHGFRRKRKHQILENYTVEELAGDFLVSEIADNEKRLSALSSSLRHVTSLDNPRYERFLWSFWAGGTVLIIGGLTLFAGTYAPMTGVLTLWLSLLVALGTLAVGYGMGQRRARVLGDDFGPDELARVLFIELANEEPEQE